MADRDRQRDRSPTTRERTAIPEPHSGPRRRALRDAPYENVPRATGEARGHLQIANVSSGTDTLSRELQRLKDIARQLDAEFVKAGVTRGQLTGFIEDALSEIILSVSDLRDIAMTQVRFREIAAIMVRLWTESIRYLSTAALQEPYEYTALRVFATLYNTNDGLAAVKWFTEALPLHIEEARGDEGEYSFAKVGGPIAMPAFLDVAAVVRNTPAGTVRTTDSPNFVPTEFATWAVERRLGFQDIITQAAPVDDGPRGSLPAPQPPPLSDSSMDGDGDDDDDGNDSTAAPTDRVPESVGDIIAIIGASAAWRAYDESLRAIENTNNASDALTRWDAMYDVMEALRGLISNGMRSHEGDATFKGRLLTAWLRMEADVAERVLQKTTGTKAIHDAIVTVLQTRIDLLELVQQHPLLLSPGVYPKLTEVLKTSAVRRALAERKPQPQRTRARRGVREPATATASTAAAAAAAASSPVMQQIAANDKSVMAPVLPATPNMINLDLGSDEDE